ncbi:GNAT family acetyltransferase [Enterococcus sp. 10A9_DIV0425]|uniref:GNAT family acetyltransferase n=1 Tax=Candidatus Enterococcus wittei TaxID=1987383 RepID=A0A242JVZ1_9ENTE|nr:GNAT family N-acetyltransferase [Enterococcus sp. 10A9_DIV0425]OTP09485.1 GNAT family acetyltransferase [Enterococcus sp. 10A9_DIV0425]
MKVVHTKDTMSHIYLDAVRIRNQVFVVEQGVPLAREIDQDEAHCIHFVLYSEQNQACGTVRLLPLENGKMKVQRMAILSEYRHQGLGQILLREAEDFAKKQGFNTMVLGAQQTAILFYEKLHYTPYGETFIDAGITHQSMTKKL